MKKRVFSRINLLGVISSILGLLIIFQLVHIQNSERHIQVEKWANEQFTYEKEIIYPERGNIYDRWGHLLAGNEEVYEVGVLLKYVKNPATIATTLAEFPDVEYTRAYATTSLKYVPKTRIYAVVDDFLPPGVINALSNIKQEYEGINPYGENSQLPSLRGLTWYPHLKRSYPESMLAANVLGFYEFRERKQPKAFYGIEEYYNNILSGPKQEILIPRDPYMISELPPIPSGSSLILTLDREIQAMVEKKLDEAVELNEAESGTIIVMDPRNGEILAMASQPRINLNQYWEFEEKFKDKIPFNRAISQTYEPGSVFKVVTMAAALDTETVTPETTFIDKGTFKYGGGVIYNWNRGAWGKQTMQGCLQHSLNVCLSWVATELGKDKFYAYLQAFGIGRRTNIDLGGEQIWPLSLPSDSDWYPINLVTNSFGQGVAVTPIQMATAISAVANGGKMMKPHVVKAIIDNGHQYNTNPQVLGVPISRKTAKTLTEMLTNSLEGEASTALVPGYRLAGKTGTSEIPVEGQYSEQLTNASFVGWGPVDDPHFLVYIWIEKPKSSPWGSTVAAPLFHDVVEDLVVLLDFPPFNIRHDLIARGQTNDVITQ